MRRVSANNPVCRRLIFDDDVEHTQNIPDQEISTERDSTSYQPRRRSILEENLKEAKVDNSVNVLQETLIRDRREKSRKWNFDFEKEEALVGKYEWFKKKGEEWVPMEPQVNDKDLRYQNENTPYHVRDASVPVIKKRKCNIESMSYEPSAKKKIDFD